MPDFDQSLQPTTTAPDSLQIAPALNDNVPKAPLQASQDRLDNYNTNEGPDLLETLSSERTGKGEEQRVPFDVIKSADVQRYATYDPNVTDLENEKAYGQSGWDRVGNSAWNVINKIGAYAIQNIGFLAGAVGAAIGGAVNIGDKFAGGKGDVVNNGNAVSLMSDNFLTQLGDIWKENVQETNPIYKTDRYTKGNIWDKLGTTSWWMDDAADRLALATGLFAPGLLEAKGVGLFGTIERAGGVLEPTGFGAKAILTMAQNPEIYGKLGRILGSKIYQSAVSGVVDLSGDAAANFKNVMRLAQNVELTTFNSIGQNALNARESQTAITKNLQEQRDKGLNSYSDADITNMAAKGATQAFWYNAPLTLLSSAWELPQVFSSFRGSMRILKKMGVVNTSEAFDEALARLAGESAAPSLMSSVKKAALTALEHGQLESSQVAIGRYVENAISGKMVNGKVEKDEDNPLVGSFKEYINNFSDPNGQNNIALGTIQGLLTTIFGRAYNSFNGEYKRENQRNRTFIEQLQEGIARRRFFNAAPDMLQYNQDGTVKMDNDKISWNQDKLAQFGASYIDHIKQYEDKLRALSTNDKTALEKIAFDSLSGLARDFFADANGKEYLIHVLRFENKKQNINPDRENDVVNGMEQTPNSVLSDSLQHVENLYKAYNAIDQRHAGMLNLPVDYKDALQVRAAALFTEQYKDAQYYNAADQIFMSDKLQKNNVELASLGAGTELIDSPSSPNEVRINEILKENRILTSDQTTLRDEYKSLINKDEINKAWKTKWAQAKDQIDKLKEENEKPENEDVPPSPSPIPPFPDNDKERESLDSYIDKAKQDFPDIANDLEEYKQSSLDKKGIPAVLDKIKEHMSSLEATITSQPSTEQKQHVKDTIDQLSALHDRIRQYAEEKDVQSSLAEDKDSDKKLSEIQNPVIRGGITTPASDENIEMKRNEPSKKTLIQHTHGTSEPTMAERRKAWMDRHQSFISRVDELSDRKDILAIKVTKTNEAGWGLNGLINHVKGFIADDKLTDATTGIVMVVYVRKNADGTISLIDRNGVNIPSDNSAEDNVNRAVYSTMGDADAKWSADYGSVSKVRDSELPYADKAFEEYRKQREEVFKKTKEQTDVHSFKVSNGVAILDNDKTAKNSVVGTLLSSDKSLDNKTLVEVSTTGIISNNQGDTIHVPSGTPVLVTSSGLTYLNSRMFTKKEADDITVLLSKLAEQYKRDGTWNLDIVSFLKGQFHWALPMVDEKTGQIRNVGENQMYINPLTWTLFLGNQKLATFTKERIEAAKNDISNAIQTRWRNVNNKLLTTQHEDTYNELSINDKGEVEIKKWSSYQRYLLSPTYKNGDVIEKRDSPLFTRVRKISSSENDFNHFRYSILDDLETPKANEQTPKSASLLFKKTFKAKTPEEKHQMELEAIVNGLIPGKLPGKMTSIDEGMLKSDPQAFMKVVADQALGYTRLQGERIEDKRGPQEDQTRKQFGDEIVNLAKKMFPAPEKRVLKQVKTVQVAKQNVPFTIDTKGNVELVEGEELSKAIEATKNAYKDEEGIKEFNDIKDAYKKENNLDTISDDDMAREMVKQAVDERKDSAIIPPAPIEKAEDIVKPEGIVEASIDDILAEVKDTPPPPKSANRTVDSLNVPRMGEKEFAKFKEWMDANLPNVPVERVATLIKKTQGGYAWGVFENGMIKIFENAAIGTEYHEAFEAVWNSFLDNNEQTAIINDYKSQNSRTNLSNQEIKEKIADEFSKYIINNKPSTLRGRIRKFFNDLVAFFRHLIRKQGAVERLFKRINTGYYSSMEVNGGVMSAYNSIAGMPQSILNEAIDHVRASMMVDLTQNSDNLFNKFKNVNLDDVFDKAKERLIQRVKYRLKEMIEDRVNHSVAEREYIDEQIKQLNNYRQIIDKKWMSIIDEVKTNLKVFNINISFKDDAAYIPEEEKTGKSFIREAFKVDVKKEAPTAIKLLFATLTNNIADINVTEDGAVLHMPIETSSPSLNGLQTAPFAKSFIQVMEAVTGKNDIKDMMNELVKLAKKEPNYVKLFKRMNGNLNNGTIDYSSLNDSDWRLLINFYNTFAKQKPVSKILYMRNNDIYFQDADLNDAVANTVASWTPSIRNSVIKKTSIIKYNPETKIYYPDHKRLEIPLDNVLKRMQFLKDLGIPFTHGQYAELQTLDQEKPLSLKDGVKSRVAQFADAVSKIQTQLKKAGNSNYFTMKWLDVAGPINTLSKLLVDATSPEESSVIFDTNNEMRQKYVLHNYLSNIANDVNNTPSLEALLQSKPYLTDVFSSHSLILKKGGDYFDEDGKRTSKKLEVGVSLGIVNRNGKNRATTKASLPQRMMLEMSAAMHGWVYNMSTADQSTEWMVNLGNTIKLSEFNNKKDVFATIANIFRGYLIDEASLIAKNRSIVSYVEKNNSHLRFFRDILSKSTATSIELVAKAGKHEQYINSNVIPIDKNITDWVEKEAQKLKQTLLSFRELKGEDNNWAIMSLTGLKNHTKEEIDNLMMYIAVNHAIGVFELHKLYYGDPFNFKTEISPTITKYDAVKRTKSAGSPKELSFNNSDFDNYANKNRNLSLKAEVTPEDIGHSVFKPYANTVTLSNIEARSILGDSNISYLKKYYNEPGDETDSSAWMTHQFYRQMELKRGTWSDEAEAFFQYDMARARRYFNDSTEHEYKYSSNDLKEADDEILKEKMPDYKVSVIKPLAYGPEYGRDFNNLVMDKYSVVPITFDLARWAGKNMIDFFYKMNMDRGESGNIQGGRDYAIVHSGRKVGATTIDKLYDETGGISKDVFSDGVKVDLQHIGYQQESSYSEDKEQTIGKQPRILTIQDIFDKGIPFGISKEEWNSLTEEEREAKSELYRFARVYNDSLNRLTEFGYHNMLDQLGIVDMNGSYMMQDKGRLSASLRNEILRRMVSSNVKKAISLDDNGEFPVSFEATNVYNEIKGIISSIVNKNLISQKVNGAPKTQVSSAMFERNKRNYVYKSGKDWKPVEDYNKLSEEEKKTMVVTSSELKMYPIDQDINGKITRVNAMEVYLPRWFKNNTSLSDEELIEYLNRPKNEGILQGLGFRIPTQKKNSIEVFRVKGFLPQSMGDSIVLPSEITTKSGSDFDYDKLNTYLKNISFDKKGFPYITKLINIDTNSEEALRDFYESHLLEKYKEFKRQEDMFERMESAENLFNAMFEDGDLPEETSLIQRLRENSIPSIDEFLSSSKGRDIYEVNRLFNPEYKKIVENEMFEAMEKIILHPDMYERLITPNQAGGELSTIRDNVVKNSKGELAHPSLISMMYKTTMRNNALSASAGRGIVANAITLYTNLQRIEAILDPKVLKLLSRNERTFIPNLRILLSHNKLSTGESTLSALKDSDGNYIADTLSNIMDGMVDVVKDPYVVELLTSNSSVQTTAVFLTMLGVSPSSVGYFINQPSITEYLKALDAAGQTFILNAPVRDRIVDMFYTSRGRGIPQTINEKSLLSNITKYNTSSLSPAEEDEQILILNEFLKYAAISSNLGAFGNAISYDSRLRGVNSFDNRATRTQKENLSNVISSVNDVLDNSFLGNLANTLDATHTALGEVLLTLKPGIRGMLTQVRNSMNVKYMTNKLRETLDEEIAKSFITYILNTETNYFANDITKLLINRGSSVAERLRNAKLEYNNVFVNALSEIADRKGLNSVKLDKRDTDVFTTDSYIDAFRELKQQDISLYKDLIKLSVIQSGLSFSKLTYSHLIPIEDYMLIAGDVMSKAQNNSDINLFYKNNAFFRNNWQNDDIVPVLTITEREDGSVPAFDYIPLSLKAMGTENHSLFIQINPKYGNRANYPMVKTSDRIIDETGKAVRQVKLFQKVMRDEINPLTLSKGEIIYKQVNAWGDGIYLQEYYKSPRPSQYKESGALPVENELADEEIIAKYDGAIKDLTTMNDDDVTESDASLIKDALTEKKSEGKIESTKEYGPESTFEGGAVNSGQSDAISKGIDFISKGDASKFFVIQGKAGTGKTTIVKDIVAPFRKSKTIYVAALAHKAKSVLLQKLNKGESRKISGYSIAGLLGMSMDNETGDFTRDNGSSSIPPVSIADIIIVDEASMVNEEALKLIMSEKSRNSKVIFIGDIGQLPPIRKQTDSNNYKPSGVFQSDNKAELTERIRQGEESPILPYADVYWNNSVNSSNPIQNPVKSSDRINKITSKGNLIFSKNFASVKDFAIKQFRKAIDTFNPNIIKIVTYRNTTRIALNEAIRKALFTNPSQFEKGDILMFQDGYNGKINGKDVAIDNSTEVSVTGIRKLTDVVNDANNKPISVNIYELNGKDSIDGSSNLFHTLTTEDKPIVATIVSSLFNKAKSMSKGPERTNTLSKAWNLKRKYADVDYGYAITSHKSQGSTYDNVIVDENDIQSVGPVSNKAKSQSMYTAITRASKTAIILYGSNPDSKSEDIDKLTNDSEGKYGPEGLPPLNDKNEKNC